MSVEKRLGTTRVRHIKYPVGREPVSFVEEYCPLCNPGADPQIMEMNAETYSWAVMEHICPYPPTPAYQPTGSVTVLTFYFFLVLYIADSVWDAIKEHQATKANPGEDHK